jgi:membrane protease YdiL (CAAX protease family)
MAPLSHNDLGESSTERRSGGAIVFVVLSAFLVATIAATLFLSVGVAVTGYRGGFSALSSSAHPPAWATVTTLMGLWVGYVGGFLVARRLSPALRRSELFRVRASDALYILLGIALQFAVVAAYAPFRLRHFSAPTDKIFSGSSGAGFVVLCVLTGLAVPIFEELFFRVALVTGLRGLLRTSSARMTVGLVALVDGVLFAAAHGEFAQFLGLAAVGAVLAAIYMRSGRLAPSALVHIAFNSTALFGIVVHRLS